MLIYAEAHTHTAGFDSQTQAALNELRDRCGMPDVPTSLSKEEGLELIANERRIELAAEGHLRPIPQTAIDLNPLLADDQNPGY